MGLNRFMGFNDRIPFRLMPGVPTTSGQVGNQNSGGTFNRLSIEVTVLRPFRLDEILWDVNTAQTYTFQQVNNVTNAPTVLRTLLDSFVTTAAPQTVSVRLNPVLYMMPGLYYFSVFCSTLVTMRRTSTNTPVSFSPYLSNTNITYNGGSAGTGSMPCRFVGKTWELKRT